MAVHSLHAVRGPQSAEAVPLDDAGKASSLAGAGDVDVLDLVEQLDGQGLTLGHVGSVRPGGPRGRKRLGSALTLRAWPRSAWVAFFRFLSSKPSCTA